MFGHLDANAGTGWDIAALSDTGEGLRGRERWGKRWEGIVVRRPAARLTFFVCARSLLRPFPLTSHIPHPSKTNNNDNTTQHTLSFIQTPSTAEAAAGATRVRRMAWAWGMGTAWDRMGCFLFFAAAAANRCPNTSTHTNPPTPPHPKKTNLNKPNQTKHNTNNSRLRQRGR